MSGDAKAVEQALSGAIKLHRAGQLDEAVALYRQALEMAPENPVTLTLIGTAYLQRKNYDEGLRWINASLEQAPDQPIALNSRAAALIEQRRHAEALHDLDKAIALKPDFAAAHNNRGNALKALGLRDEALASYDKAIAADANFTMALINAGALLTEMNAPEAALLRLDQAVARAPASVEAHVNRAAALLKAMRFEDALAASERALALDPNHPLAHNNRAIALRDLDRIDEALAEFAKAITGAPQNAQMHNFHGALLERSERYDEALASYDAAMALGDADGAFNRALLKLKLGAFEEGWRLYESRWSTSRITEKRRTFDAPLWLGGDDLRGKTILLHMEQGQGDAIQFCRYASMVEAKGARVILEAHPSLVTLFRSLSPSIEIIERGTPAPAFDFHCPLLSLPLAFGATLETIPARTPYLAASPEKTAQWRDRLGAKHAPRVGFCIVGGAVAQNNRERSIPIETFERLFELDLDFHCLQKEIPPADHQVLKRHARVRTHCADLKDFSDTAALAANMDLVVSVETAVAHLAGALGLRLWIPLSHTGDFRWLTKREDSPWYPTARLIRQPRPNAWDAVVERIANDLRAI